MYKVGKFVNGSSIKSLYPPIETSMYSYPVRCECPTCDQTRENEESQKTESTDEQKEPTTEDINDKDYINSIGYTRHAGKITIPGCGTVDQNLISGIPISIASKYMEGNDYRTGLRSE